MTSTKTTPNQEPPAQAAPPVPASSLFTFTMDTAAHPEFMLQVGALAAIYSIEQERPHSLSATLARAVEAEFERALDDVDLPGSRDGLLAVGRLIVALCGMEPPKQAQTRK